MKLPFSFLAVCLLLTSCGLSKKQQTALDRQNTASDICKSQYPDQIGNMSLQAECLSTAFTKYAPNYAGQYYNILDQLDSYRLKLWKAADTGIISIPLAHLYYNKAKQTAIANDQEQTRTRQAQALTNFSNTMINASRQEQNSTSMNTPTTYNIQSWGNSKTITGSDGSYITCNNFSSSTQCTKTQ